MDGNRVNQILGKAGYEALPLNEQDLSWPDVNPLRTARLIGLDWGSGKIERRPHYEWLP